MEQLDEKTVIPLSDASGVYRSGIYREWFVGVNGTRYGIIDDHGLWTLIRADVNAAGVFVDWVDERESVDAFLARHKLILGT